MSSIKEKEVNIVTDIEGNKAVLINYSYATFCLLITLYECYHEGSQKSEVIMHQKELENIIYAYGRDLYSFCCSVTRNVQEAEDLYQETFLKFYEMKETLFVLKNPKSFLMSVSVNLYRNYKRKRSIRQNIVGAECSLEEAAVDLPAREQLTEEQILLQEKYQILRNEVKRLPDKYKIPILLFYMEELSLREICQVLKLPEGTVKSRIYRAKKILKERLEDSRYE